MSKFDEQSTELDLFGTAETKSEIKRLIKEHFTVTNHTRKDELRLQIDDKVKEHIIKSCGHQPDVIAKVDAIESTNRPFFLWHVYFNDVFEKGGFDIVIGNPPYGFRTVLSAADKSYFRKVQKIAFASGDSAELFLKICFDRLVAKNGILSFIIPKKSLYGDAWEDTRVNYWGKYDLCFLLDTGKSFDEVLLEASAFGVRKEVPSGKVSLAFLRDDKFIERFIDVPFDKILNTANTIQIYSVLYSDALLSKIASKSKVGNSGIDGKLGLAIGTKFYSDTPKEYKLLH